MSVVPDISDSGMMGGNITDRHKIEICRLLRLNLEVRGEHLTSQLTRLAALLLVKHVCPVYLVEERHFRVIF